MNSSTSQDEVDDINLVRPMTMRIYHELKRIAFLYENTRRSTTAYMYKIINRRLWDCISCKNNKFQKDQMPRCNFCMVPHITAIQGLVCEHTYCTLCINELPFYLLTAVLFVHFPAYRCIVCKEFKLRKIYILRTDIPDTPLLKRHRFGRSLHFNAQVLQNMCHNLLHQMCPSLLSRSTPHNLTRLGARYAGADNFHANIDHSYSLHKCSYFVRYKKESHLAKPMHATHLEVIANKGYDHDSDGNDDNDDYDDYSDDYDDDYGDDYDEGAGDVGFTLFMVMKVTASHQK
ncbi:hypothetical protein PUN28_020650 [Cardiocondyla obscurior]|uniref:RING-type domain-containing protein n=1 Tax=Cardiocondyla obscurior TaxID=286306 RepID=A0AAW2E4V5_9HYME